MAFTRMALHSYSERRAALLYRLGASLLFGPIPPSSSCPQAGTCSPIVMRCHDMLCQSHLSATHLSKLAVSQSQPVKVSWLVRLLLTFFHNTTVCVPAEQVLRLRGGMPKTPRGEPRTAPLRPKLHPKRHPKLHPPSISTMTLSSQVGILAGHP
jgi:hypothetical protein